MLLYVKTEIPTYKLKFSQYHLLETGVAVSHRGEPREAISGLVASSEPDADRRFDRFGGRPRPRRMVAVELTVFEFSTVSVNEASGVEL